MKRLLAVVVALLLLVLGAVAFVALSGDEGSEQQADRVESPAPSAPVRETAATRRPRRPSAHAPTDVAPPVVEPPEVEPPPTPVDAKLSGPRPLGHVDVTVTREDGSPVRGATVAVFGTWGRMSSPPGAATTDADGRARLSLTSVAFRLRATKGREAALGPRISVGPGATLEQVLVITAARVVTGRVVDGSDRSPVDYAHVSARLRTDDPFGLDVNTRTEPDGAFALPAVPESYFAEPVTIDVKAEGFMAYRTKLLPGDRDEPLLVELGRGLVVRGRCVRVGAVPVALVGVSTHGATSPSYGQTGEDGRFELRGVGLGLREVVFQAEEFALRREPLVAGTDREIDLGDVLLEPGGTVRGIVVDGAGEPLPGSSVSLRYDPLDLQVRHTTAGDDGRFRLDAVGEGLHTLVAKEPRVGDNWSRLDSVAVRGVTADGEELRVVIRGELSLVVVFLLESDRSPLAVAEVKLEARRRDSENLALGKAWAGGDLQSVRVHFQAPGLYDVTISLPGYLPATLDAVEVFPDREARIEALVRKAPE